MEADEVLEAVRGRLGGALGRVEVRGPDRVYVELDPSAVRSAAEFMLREFNARLSSMSAVDLGLDYQLMYHYAMGGLVLSFRVTVPKEVGKLPSIADIYPGAEWLEGEASDLFGIRFEGGREGRTILPPDWPEGEKPLLKPAETWLPEAQRMPVEALMKYGNLSPITAGVSSRRKRIGLSPQLPTVDTKPEVLDKVRRVLRETGLDREVGFDWSKQRIRGGGK